MSQESTISAPAGRSWTDICDDPLLARLPYRIETDRWGNLVMSPPPNRRHFFDPAGPLDESRLCPEFPKEIDLD